MHAAAQVLNDDLVKANAGFGAHPHRDAEIFSYIVDGALSPKDSMGNKVRQPSASRILQVSNMGCMLPPCLFAGNRRRRSLIFLFVA